MTRCSYEGVFYRVFCATLLAIALTFTVILTNVFIDIDGLLASKEKETEEATVTTPPLQYQEIENNEVFYQPDEKVNKPISEDFYQTDVRGETKENEVYQPYEQELDSYDLKPDRDEEYRTKRSIDSSAAVIHLNGHSSEMYFADTPNVKFHLANPKMKEMLNNRLSTLLEELDAEESQTAGQVEPQKTQEPAKTTEVTNLKNNSEEEKDKNRKEESEVLHLAMHNILLQGIIGHMDLNEVYNKVHGLIQSFDENDESLNRRSMNGNSAGDGKDEKAQKHFHNYPELSKTEKKSESLELPESSQNLFSVESKFFDELMKCEELQKQISAVASIDGRLTRKTGKETKKIEVRGPKMLIKTIIDIKTLNKNDKHNETQGHTNTNNVKGLIKLIYNGKSINFSRMDDDETEKNNHSETLELQEDKPEVKTDTALNNEGNVVQNFLDKALSQYLEKYPKLESKFKSRRLKRNVKIHKHNKPTEKPKNEKNKKPDEEELYVEIETHFDSKGVNGEKKKKLVKAIIAKIQKALRVNKDTLQKGGRIKQKADMLQIKKRLQNPLKVKEENVLSNKIILPVEGIILRKSAPISKSIKVTDQMPKIYNQMGEIWQKTYTGSNFLSNAKSINSGEMGLVDLDYSRVGKSNGIPQRLQQPLNSDNIDSQSDNSDYYNIGDLKFYVKEIDGTGFSIGFNQYVGDAPDPESIKLFTGLQQLINVYNENSDNLSNSQNNNEQNYHEVNKRDVGSVDRLASILGGKGLHSNEYKITFGEQSLPYDTYSEMFEDGRKKVSFSIEKEKRNRPTQFGSKDAQKIQRQPLHLEIENMQFDRNPLPFIIDEDIFKKPLKPAEIFGLANLLNRKKRSPIVKIKKYSNLKTKGKPHMNRYLNTKRKVKRIVKNNKNKRNKRQIDKIRIIATDNMPHMSRHSDENFYVVSDENMFADRAVVRDIDMPDQEQSEPEERNDFLHHVSNQLSPYNIFSARSRHNTLMSKYPHLFLEEITRSKEEDNPMFYSKLLDNYADIQKNIEATASPYSIVTPFAAPDNQFSPYQSPNVYESSDSRPNYKLTVKIIPKNQTEVPDGFKSIRTSINKTINRNGILFLSQLNVSELSKVENLNKDNHNYNENNNQFKRVYIPEERKNITDQITKPAELRNSEPNSKPMQLSVGSDTFPLVKHIKEQQEKMKMLLKQHKQRIDEQLDNLKLEKQNLDSMIVRSLTETTSTSCPPQNSDTIDVLLPLNPPQMLHLNKDEAGQLISNALMKLHDAPHLNDISEKNQNINNVQITTTTSTTTHPTAQTTTTIQPPKKTIDPEKLKLLRTIQRNENLTNVILYKIDKNTNLLQHFLQKLTERLEPTTRRPEYIERNKFNPIHEPFFSHTMPNMEVNKNATHVSIPFVYAYQQPYPLPAANNPVASVVYQGHIHTNAYNNALTKNNGKPDKREVNNTKFFLDDLEPGFKLVPVPIRKEPYEIPRVKNNITVEYNIKKN